MKISKPSTTVGAWLKASEVVSGTRAKIVSEAIYEDGEYGQQLVAKIRLESDTEPKNTRINKPSQSGLIEAFGEDSKDWINKYLIVQTEKMRVGGKAVTAMYLIPEGFEARDDENGYLVIVRKNQSDTTPQDSPQSYPEEDINPDDIPF